ARCNVCPKPTVCVGGNAGWRNRNDRAGKRLAGVRVNDTSFNRSRGLECERDVGWTLLIACSNSEYLRRVSGIINLETDRRTAAHAIENKPSLVVCLD